MGTMHASGRQDLLELMNRLASSPGAREFLSTNLRLDPSRFAWSAIVDVTTGCNLDCPMCDSPRKALRFAAGPELWEALAQQVLPIASWVAVGTRHEPLLDPDLPEHLRSLSDARDALRERVFLCLLTSGTLLEPSRIPRLLRAGLDVILLSIDSSDPETYARLRRPATWPELVRRVGPFLASARETSVRVNAQALLMTSTLPRLVQTVCDLGALGVRRFHVSQLVWAPPRARGEVLRFEGPEGPVIRQTLAQVVAKAHGLGMEVAVPHPAAPLPDGEVVPVRGNGDVEDEDRLKHVHPAVCVAPWYKLRVDAEGWVFPCSLMLSRRHAWGNLLERPLSELINCEKAVSLRADLLAGRVPNPACARCPFGPL